MTRNAELYISSQLMRWLRWLAEMRSGDDGGVTADAVAEDILRKAILANVPNIEQAEAQYWMARQKLDQEAVKMISNNKLRDGATERRPSASET